MRRRQIAAIFALLLSTAALGLMLFVLVNRFLGGLAVMVLLPLAAVAAWYGLRRRGAARAVGLLAAVLLLAADLVTAQQLGVLLEGVLTVAAFIGALIAARAAFRTQVALPAAPPPERPVLFYNPKSGGGKAERFHLADEARKRGIKPIELKLGKNPLPTTARR